MKLTIRKLTVIVLGLSVILLSLLAFEILYINQKVTTIQALQTQHDQLQETANQSLLAGQVLGQYVSDLDRIANAYVDSGNRIKVLSQLELLGQASQVEIDIESIDEVTTPEGVVTGTQIELRGRGSWIDLNRYVARVENLPYFVRLPQLSLNKAVGPAGDQVSDTDTSQSFWQLDVELFFPINQS